jgi:hypothetical protein
MTAARRCKAYDERMSGNIFFREKREDRETYRGGDRLVRLVARVGLTNGVRSETPSGRARQFSCLGPLVKHVYYRT